MVLVSMRYEELVSKGEISFDAAQWNLTKHFDDLLQEISAQKISRPWTFWHFFKKQKYSYVSKQYSADDLVQGLYIYGEVGRGKTMLMDLFFSCLPEGNKKRAHFNDFMADVHERINEHRQAFRNEKSKKNDPILVVAENLARETRVLCFDEFSVTDIADAMVLGRLVSALFNQGVIFVATSNVAPDNLYYNGLNRELFMPFIQILKTRVFVINLDAKTDYRLEKSNPQNMFITPLGQAADESMDHAWTLVLQGQKETSDNISVKGRSIHVPRFGAGCARFNYQDLCAKPLAAVDYLALGENYHTIFIDHVPVMDDARRNETKRFILLIDILYERHIRLFISAEAELEQLYKGQAQTTETFEFRRTQSRLFEMQSQDYLNIWAEQFLKK
ncbi:MULTISPECIES: cell division protein ZapE [unclassified Bartonella]|uniref:cell division protein ZapE n=1 Tax=unclassified Bartonella TaxID=2645622 RepID=UPI00099B0B79|nr:MULTISPECIES: cell division protein ZapE [unclassified Bartonella]AQX28583.1 cell division protein ZapE [Bartonella sp. JB15]AQX29842.1 cell division protein ZapE [Bartonella sp. JB63]